MKKPHPLFSRLVALFVCSTALLMGCPDKPVSDDVFSGDALVIHDVRDVPVNSLADRAESGRDSSGIVMEGSVDDTVADGGPSADVSVSDGARDALADGGSAMDGAGSDALPVGMTPPDPDDPDRFNTIAQPDPRFENMAATLTVNGVEFIDPDGLLAGRMVTVASLNPAMLVPAVQNAIESWQFEPSGPLGGIVYARFPLAVARTPGERLLLWTLDPVDRNWSTQAVGRVLAGGRRVLFAMSHFSPQTVAYETAARLAFINGTDCRLLDGGTDAEAGADVPDPVLYGDPLDAGQHLPADVEIRTVGAREIAYTHEMGLCLLRRMTDNPNIRSMVVFKNEDPVPYENEDLYGDPNIEAPLEALARSVRERSCGSLTLRVTENFDSLREHTGGSTHFEGRGIDLTLAESTPGGALPGATAGLYTAGYGRLARLASEAGFDWAWYENAEHVHAAVRRGVEGAARAAAINRCHERGVQGSVRSMGANGVGAMAPGTGGTVSIRATGTFPGRQPGMLLERSFSVPPGGTVNSIPAVVSFATISGTVNLAVNTVVQVDYGFYLAPSGRINCSGCNLVLNSRGNIQIDGLIDLSANQMSASRNGGNFVVTVPTNLVPVVRVPSVDVRGGDGDGAVGGRGGDITISGVGDLVVGYEPGGAIGPLSRIRGEHVLQGGNSWTVFPIAPTRAPYSALVSSGGAGGVGVLGGAMTTGFAGGNGGPIIVSLTADGANLLGHTYFFDTFISTGATPNVRGLSPVELFNFNAPSRGVGPIDLGVGGVGGLGAQSFGNARGGNGGAGGNGGDLTLSAPAATLCPSLAGAADFFIDGANGAGARVGAGRRAMSGACALSYTVSGGSGGMQGGSLTGFPGTAGAAGMPGTAMVP